MTWNETVNILLLSHVIPYPPNNGHRLRAHFLARAIASEHDLTICCVLQDEQELENMGSLQEFCEVIPVVAAKVSRTWTRHLGNLFTSTEPIAIGPDFPEMREQLQALLRARKFDAVQVQTLNLARYVADYREVIRVLDVSDVDYQRLGRECAIRPVLERYYRRIDAWKLRRYEERAWREFDACFAISDPVADLIRTAAPRVEVRVIPHCVSMPPAESPPSQEVPGRLVFVGDLSYRPNSDAVEFFCHRILPIITSRCPGVTFFVVGNNPSQSIHDLNGAGVTVTGYVPEVRSYIGAAAVVVVPLRAGSGVKTKILDAWAMGKPVVTTSLGAEGLPAKPDENMVIADTPRRFAEAVIGLLGSQDLRHRMGQRGREAVRMHHSWEQVRDSIVRAYAEIKERRRAQGGGY